jgi:predicted pyridoxine 5'-phosphate oxidase superfamily flavin-nucleotide-binding protein
MERVMSDFYGAGARHFQTLFDTGRLADRAREILVHQAITLDDRALIESAEFFFLATVDANGQPQCSYKGGERGFVKVVDDQTIAFPSYDGNGMFLSLGNVRETRRVGLLFINFENPSRLRLNGTAEVHEQDPLLAAYHEAQVVVRVRIGELFINCPRYVPTCKQVESSPYVPHPCRRTPIPDWKRKHFLRDVLPERDKRRLAEDEASGSSGGK